MYELEKEQSFDTVEDSGNFGYAYDESAVNTGCVLSRCCYVNENISPKVASTIKEHSNLSAEELNEYFNLSKIAEPIEYCLTITEENIAKYHKRGRSLFSRLLERFNLLMSKGEFLKIDTFVKPKNKPKRRLLDAFLDFSERNGSAWKDSNSVLKLYFGEGDSLIDVKIPEKINSNPRIIDIICGPRMIRYDNNKDNPIDSLKLNNFLSYVLSEDIQFKIAVNRLVSFIPGFAGYFHVYIYESNIAFEALHEIGASDDDDAKHVCYMLHDAELVDEANAFFNDYKKLFTADCGTFENYDEVINELLCRVTTYKKEKFEEYIISGEYLEQLRSQLKQFPFKK